MPLGQRTRKIGTFLVRAFDVGFLIVVLVWSLRIFLMKFGNIFFTVSSEKKFSPQI